MNTADSSSTARQASSCISVPGYADGGVSPLPERVPVGARGRVSGGGLVPCDGEAGGGVSGCGEGRDVRGFSLAW